MAEPLIRRRRRLVMDVDLAVDREPSAWGASEHLMIIDGATVSSLSPALLASIAPDNHREDFDGICHGNVLFVVAHENLCLYRSYACVLARAGLNKAVFFNGLEDLPEIRGAEVALRIPPAVQRGMLRGLHLRVMNEQLRTLRELGYTRAVLFITAENTLSIKGATSAGFRLHRYVTDWVLFRRVVVQHVSEQGRTYWRLFAQ